MSFPSRRTSDIEPSRYLESISWRNVCCTEFARANSGEGRGDARTDAFNLRVIDERSTPFERAENHGLEICRDPEIRGWWIFILKVLTFRPRGKNERRKIEGFWKRFRCISTSWLVSSEMERNIWIRLRTNKVFRCWILISCERICFLHVSNDL